MSTRAGVARTRLVSSKARLPTFPDVLITGNQAFCTADALKAAAETIIANIDVLAKTGRAVHEVTEAT